MAVYKSRSIKRKRRTKGEVDVIKAGIYDILSKDNPQTCRGVFYQATVRGLVGKTENEYKNTVVRLLSEMRKNKELPFSWLADNTRWMRKPQSYDGVKDALESTWRLYRRNIWNHLSAYVEVWVEKEALAGVIFEETKEWDVPLMVTRGYPSLSYLHEAAQNINDIRKSAYIYYFGDYDPSGLDISRNVENGLRSYAPDAEIYFERVGVTLEQIESMNLPSRPTKKTDSRSKNFQGDSTELDAIPARVLREMVKDCITQHIDTVTYNAVINTEAAERKTFENLIYQFSL